MEEAELDPEFFCHRYREPRITSETMARRHWERAGGKKSGNAHSDPARLAYGDLWHSDHYSTEIYRRLVVQRGIFHPPSLLTNYLLRSEPLTVFHSTIDPEVSTPDHVICIHVFYPRVLREMIQTRPWWSALLVMINFSLPLTSQERQQWIDELSPRFPFLILTRSPNAGSDILPFFLQYQLLLRMLPYRTKPAWITKLHTKLSENERSMCMDYLQVDLQLSSIKENVGMIGSKDCFFSYPLRNTYNRCWRTYYEKGSMEFLFRSARGHPLLFAEEGEEESDWISDLCFFAGTMFTIRPIIVEAMWDRLCGTGLIARFHYTFRSGTDDTLEHATERAFGYYGRRLGLSIREIVSSTKEKKK